MFRTAYIAFFFGLKAGLLYKTLDDIGIELTPDEREIYELCMRDIQNENMDYREEEYLKWYGGDTTVDGEKIRRFVTRKRDYKKSADYGEQSQTKVFMRKEEVKGQV